MGNGAKGSLTLSAAPECKSSTWLLNVPVLANPATREFTRRRAKQRGSLVLLPRPSGNAPHYTPYRT